MTGKTQILDLNRFDPTAPGEKSALLQARQRHAGQGSVLFYAEPIEMVKGEGVWLTAADGRRYLDVYNNVPSVGHCHPRVAEAIARQAATLTTHTRYLTKIVEKYAERLLETLPAGLSNLVMTCSGTEANDLALRIAEAGTGGRGFIVTEAAYHGNSAAVNEISPSAWKSRGPAAHVRLVPAPKEPGFDRAVAAAAASLNEAGIGVAALIVDSIFSSDGIFPDPAGFLAPAVAAVRAAGGLFIADEVQPGFGRTGAGMWGFGRHGVEPDIVTMGKPMGNGFPMAGVVTRPDLLGGFCEETGYFNTFGGNPVAAAAGLAVLDVIRDEGLIENAREVGTYFRDGLVDLGERISAMGEVRGAGLFIGLDFIDPETGAPNAAKASRTINALKDKGILIGAAGLYANTLKIRPPLPFSRDNADFFLKALGEIVTT
ncbi:aspartate aminotransferase family protein [Paenirhodobacter populi]|uniref:aspartate aminotransferase family protein n=1 Tax=Paenirhodobacter populi TaxID=2306993 RepID=UPI000FE36F47|nr:aminotransferase class III-fold pyridoxal phosphate-dependent enzyme [Sinirhodobacter populi]RWR06195.1 aminotransferase class III-fold pyridoxal phosphate-dependent enzyme [Sinirhodobacter populi]